MFSLTFCHRRALAETSCIVSGILWYGDGDFRGDEAPRKLCKGTELKGW